MKFLSKLSKTQRVIFGLVALALVGGLFYWLGKSSIKSRLEADLAAIDNRMSSGRASASELIDLRLRKKAILQQYLKSI